MPVKKEKKEEIEKQEPELKSEPKTNSGKISKQDQIKKLEEKINNLEQNLELLKARKKMLEIQLIKSGPNSKNPVI